MRDSSPLYLERVIMSALRARSALRRIASESDSPASCVIFLTTQGVRILIWPTARSIARRRISWAILRTWGSFDHRCAVARGTLLSRAHERTDFPRAIAKASWSFVASTSSSDMARNDTNLMPDSAVSSYRPTRGSQPGAQAGRHALEGQGNGVWSVSRSMIELRSWKFELGIRALETRVASVGFQASNFEFRISCFELPVLRWFREPGSNPHGRPGGSRSADSFRPEPIFFPLS